MSTAASATDDKLLLLPAKLGPQEDLRLDVFDAGAFL